MNPLTTRTKPEYFDEIAQKARQRWKQLEADPELAGPWHQLFSQVQSPRHVLSELLQNADDAGANNVRVRIETGYFLFEHDGQDFSRDEFASLCRFGYSNKRNLHTIGFRGIGFKSTFSLGDNVDVLTQSLAVRFEKRRFTRPRWIENAGEVGKMTIVRVQIQDEHRHKELEKNFEDWTSSPASLLFFANVRSLEIQGQKICRESTRPGPCEGSQWYNLVGHETHEVLVVRSQPETLPSEAVAEIKKERNADDLHLPPCQVEVVFGLELAQKVYVVLPTGVRPELPFSINGPFLQDPARFGIKDPSVSPTNRWLLDRAGKLAAQSMLSWLGDSNQIASERAAAYAFLPAPARLGDSLDQCVTFEVVESFRYEVIDKPLLLTHEGTLAKPGTCSAFPARLFRVWPAEVLREFFCVGSMGVLSPDVSSNYLKLFSLWSWANSIEDNALIRRLMESNPPKPRDWFALANLWEFVSRVRKNNFKLNPGAVNVAPVEGSDRLHAPSEMVRLSARQSSFSPRDLEFVSGLVNIVDPGWIEFLREQSQADEKNLESFKYGTSLTASLGLLKEIGLDSPSSTERILAQAYSQVPSDIDVMRRITHIYAATDTAVPRDFRYYVQDESLVPVSDGVLIDSDGILEEVLPEKTIKSHLIHDSYIAGSESCTQKQWQAWAISGKSRLSILPPFKPSPRVFETRSGFESFLTSRSVAKPVEYQYKGRASYRVEDKSFSNSLFSSSLVTHLDERLNTEPHCWANFVLLLLKGDASHWSENMTAHVYEVSANGNDRRAKCDPVPSDWVLQLGQRPCLFDTFNRACIPAELLLRTPATEPLMGVESFVKAEYDTPENRPLLELLGARVTPAGPEKLIARIKALAAMDEPPIHELAKWYEAIDKVVARSTAEDISLIRTEFEEIPLIYTQSGELAKVVEVFRFVDNEGLPDAPTIHREISDLRMWSRLGVADRPTPELVINWLRSLPTNKRLDANTRRRVRGCLQTYPDRIWKECRGWLSLDDRWTDIDDFEFLTVRDRTVRVTDLFPSILAKTADLRNLKENDYSHPNFSALRDLGASLDLRLTASVPSPQSRFQSWHNKLGEMLTRFSLPNDLGKEASIRQEAKRLANSKWSAMRTLQVTPYLNGEPAGQAFGTDVVWMGKNLHVIDKSFASIYRKLVDELARPFALQSIADAIRACAGRTDDFIEEYINHHFKLAEESAAVSCGDGVTTVDDDFCVLNANQPFNGKELARPLFDMGATQTNGNDSTVVPIDESKLDGEDILNDSPDLHRVDYGDDIPTKSVALESEQRQKMASEISRSAKTPLIRRYAKAKGFKWVIANQVATNAKSLKLRKSDGVLPWHLTMPNGTVICRLYVTAQSLVEGVELPAEVWNVVKQSPDDCAFVFEDITGHPVEITGEAMMEFFENEQVRLYPAKYRLRQTGELQLQQNQKLGLAE